MMHHTQKLEMGRKVRASLILAEVERRNTAGASIETVQPVYLRSLLLTLVNAVNEGKFWHGVPTLAAWSETPRRTVQRCMAILVAVGIVEREERNRAQGSVRADRTTIYRLRWTELEKYCIDDATSARAAPVHRRAPAAPLFANTRQRGACSSTEHAPPRRPLEVERAPAEARTGASGAAQVVASAETCGTESVELKRVNPPPTPQASVEPVGGGGGASELVDEAGDRSAAEAIVAAYPPTNGAAHGLDIRAAVDAIRRERVTDGGCTPVEILAAVQALAKEPPKPPLWCRTWLKNRCYAAHTEAVRRRTAAQQAATRRVQRHSLDRAAEDQRLRDELRRVSETLAVLSTAELDALEAEAIAAQPVEFVRNMWRKLGGAQSASLRAEMAAILHRRRGQAA